MCIHSAMQIIYSVLFNRWQNMFSENKIHVIQTNKHVQEQPAAPISKHYNTGRQTVALHIALPVVAGMIMQKKLECIVNDLVGQNLVVAM